MTCQPTHTRGAGADEVGAEEMAPRPELNQYTPICVPCQRNYRCERNGIFVRLGPNAIIDADLYECPGCGNKIVRGFAVRAVERHGGYQAVFVTQDNLMGDATITDHKGQPITQDQLACIPAEDAPEAGASQERWR